MKLGIMQPYFIPYIGYWQLMNAVDKYVIYDDVNFIKGGWINRNYILVNGKPKYFNIPMLGASPHKLINEVGVNNDLKLIEKNMRIMENAYKKALYFAEVFPLVVKILYCNETSISEYIEFSFKIIKEYLGITTDLIRSSSLNKNCSLRAQERVLHICDILGASEYYNAIGGMELYSSDAFKKRGIELKFIKTGVIKYEQFGGEFQSDLSIIDVMMFNSPGNIQNMLNNYELVIK